MTLLRSPASLRSARWTPALVVVGSVLLHAGVAMALVATSGGHRAGAVSLATIDSVDIETLPAPEPLLEKVAEPEPEAVHPNTVTARPTHTHDYPVAPDHDAHPHDPSLAHDHGAEPDHHEEAAPAEAAPVLAAAPALPHFDLSSGSGQPAAGRVSAAGAGVSGVGGNGEGKGTADDDVVVPAAGVQVPAQLVSSVVAAYPTGARSDDVEGDVGVEIVVDREGRVIDARVVSRAGHGFDDAALSAIRRYRFRPAQRAGRAVRVRMPWTVQFRLR